MDLMNSWSLDQMQWVYIVVIAILVALVFGLGWRRRNQDSEAVLDLMGRFDDFGLGAIYQIITVLGIACMAWMGWRLPGDIESYAVSGLASDEAFPTTSTLVARAAQIVGALGLTAIALRNMRYVVPVVVLLLVIVLIAAAMNYVMALV